MTTCIFTLGSVISESSLGVVTPPQKFLVPVQRSLSFLPGMEYSEGGGTAVEEGQKYVRQRFSVAWAGKVIRAPRSSFLLPLSLPLPSRMVRALCPLLLVHPASVAVAGAPHWTVSAVSAGTYAPGPSMVPGSQLGLGLCK